ncbi:MAG TPA: hypothetical protein VEJ87_16845, partial [Acidimicrobiales bacterium]|nr:hypothetical protein [Acidimicrobiales bacterium]
MEVVYVDNASRPLPPAADDALDRAYDAGARIFDLAPGVIEKLGGTVSPQPILAIVHTPAYSLDDLKSQQDLKSAASFVVVCADLRDPGNAGTVIRSADAAGADAVVF